MSVLISEIEASIRKATTYCQDILRVMATPRSYGGLLARQVKNLERNSSPEKLIQEGNMVLRSDRNLGIASWQTVGIDRGWGGKMEGGRIETVAWTPVRKGSVSVAVSSVRVRSLDEIGPVAAQSLGNIIVNRLPWQIRAVEIVEHIRNFRHMVSALVLPWGCVVPVICVERRGRGLGPESTKVPGADEGSITSKEIGVHGCLSVV